MELKCLVTHQSLIVEISEELIDFTSFLDIPLDVDMNDDHIYINDAEGSLSLGSFFIRRDSDELVPTHIFYEVLLDIKSGMTVLEAFNKQGYTFGIETKEYIL